MAEFKNSAAENDRHHSCTNHDPRLHHHQYARRHAQSTLPLSPTSDLGASKNSDNQHVDSPSDSTDSRTHYSTFHAISSGPETFVITPSGTIRKLPGDILEIKELNTIFDEVSTLIPENDFQRIYFKLETSEGEIVKDSLLERGEVGLFKLTIQRFRRCIEERKEALRIVLEPQAQQQGARDAGSDDDKLYTSNY